MSDSKNIMEVSVRGTELEAPDVKTITFDKIFNGAQPGQFLMVGAYDGGEKPFSLSSKVSITVKKIPSERKAEFTFTEKLFPLERGDKIYLRGPLGKGFNLEKDRPYVLVGGGIGLAPLRFAAETLAAAPSVTTFAGGKTKDDVIFKDDFQKRGTLHVSTESESDGKYTGTVVDLMKDTPKESWVDDKTNYLLCGPERMIVAAAEYLEELGTRAKDIQCAIERYMKCGAGLCGACSCGGYRTCVDGPVFTYGVLKENKHFGEVKRDKSGGLIDI